MRRLVLTALAAAALLVPAADAAAPQAAVGLRAVGGSVQAGYFVFTATGGATRSGSVVVSSSGTGTVRLSAVDGGTGTTTGTTYLTGERPQGAGSWILLGKTSLALAPGKSARVPFTVEVPAGVAAGQYVGGIVAEATDQHAGTGKTSTRIEVRSQAIVAVQLNVPGAPIHEFALGKVAAGGANGFQQVIFRVSNEGNVLERPAGSVAIHGAGGTLVETLRFRMDTFLPHTSIDYPLELKRALPAGTYSAAVTLRYALGSPAGTRTATERQTFTVAPEDVRKAFATATLAALTTAGPTAVTTAGTGSASGGTSTVVYAAIAAGAAVLLLLIVLLVGRRRRRPAAIVTIPAPVPRNPAAALPPLAPAPASVPIPEPAPTDGEPTAPEPGAAEPEAAEPASACDPYHYWEVDYDTGVQGSDGVWRFPHRCKNCGLEVLARDVTDASEQAAAQQ